jgi:hypothetical protein
MTLTAATEKRGTGMTSPGIPSEYNGVVYRSRGEARWAVFLTELGVQFEYEPQGFATGDSWYLPDFVKDSWHADPEGIAKFRAFADHRPRPSRAALLVGVPSVDGEHLVIGGDIDASDPGHGPWEDDGQTWRPCPSGHHFDLAYPGKYRSKYAEDGCIHLPGNPGEDRIARATAKALSARFKAPAPTQPAA